MPVSEVRAVGVRSNRVVSIILWVLRAPSALMFLVAAMGKFSGTPESVGSFAALGAPDWLRYAVGVLEVAGAVALLIPPLTVRLIDRFRAGTRRPAR